MKYVLILCIALISACNYIFYPLKGNYPYERSFAVQRDFNYTWDRTFLYLSAKGIKCDTIERNAGRIVTGKIDFIKDYTFEDPEGKLISPNKSIVLSNKRNAQKYDTVTKPFRLQLRLNIKITASADSCIVTTFFTPYYINYADEVVRPEKKIPSWSKWKEVVKSTGNFERNMEEFLK